MNRATRTVLAIAGINPKSRKPADREAIEYLEQKEREVLMAPIKEVCRASTWRPSLDDYDTWFTPHKDNDMP